MKIKAWLHSSSNRNWLVLGASLIEGTVVRWLHISSASIWHDEGYTMMLAPDSPGQILVRTARDVHPPFYYLLLHYWLLLFGRSEAAARSLSLVAMVGVILVGFFLVRRLFGDAPARLAAVLLAFGPFLIRYSQEARMYGLVAFLLVLATYIMVKAEEDGGWLNWSLYSLVLALALYTHYYSIFIIPVHWLYMLVRTDWKRRRSGVLNPAWWGSNILAAGLFAPWLPVAYQQFSRVQASFWIPQVGPLTLTSTVAQFLTFTDLGAVPVFARQTAVLALAAIMVALLVRYRRQAAPYVLVIAYATLAPVLVFLLSFRRPIYVDRYFVFSAVGFYALLAVMAYKSWPWEKFAIVRYASIIVLLLTCLVGISNVYSQSNHKMRQTGAYVSEQFQLGDELVSGELYTYFDFSYYNRTGHELKLYAPAGVNGYGESSLFYERADQVVIRNLSTVKPRSGYVWMVGKTGSHDYFDNVPASWQVAGPHFTAGYTAAQRYRVTK